MCLRQNVGRQPVVVPTETRRVALHRTVSAARESPSTSHPRLAHRLGRTVFTKTLLHWLLLEALYFLLLCPRHLSMVLLERVTMLILLFMCVSIQVHVHVHFVSLQCIFMETCTCSIRFTPMHSHGFNQCHVYRFELVQSSCRTFGIQSLLAFV